MCFIYYASNYLGTCSICYAQSCCTISTYTVWLRKVRYFILELYNTDVKDKPYTIYTSLIGSKAQVATSME